MKFLETLFGRSDKKREIERLNHELKISIERIEKNKEQQDFLQRATMDGEDGWFYRVCIEPKPTEGSKHGTISNDAVSSLGT